MESFLKIFFIYIHFLIESYLSIVEAASRNLIVEKKHINENYDNDRYKILVIFNLSQLNQYSSIWKLNSKSDT